MKLTMPKGDGRPMGTELSLKVCYNYKYDDRDYPTEMVELIQDTDTLFYRRRTVEYICFD